MIKLTRLNEKSRCWKGYKPTPGKKPYSKGSCMKEAIKLDEINIIRVKADKSRLPRLATGKGTQMKGAAQRRSVQNQTLSRQRADAAVLGPNRPNRPKNKRVLRTAQLGLNKPANEAKTLKGGQKKLDKNKNGRLDTHDFMILRGEHGPKKAKGVVEGSPAWQRKEGKNPEGGLNAKGVASYRAANPGSKLKTAVTTKPSKLKKGSKAASRRKSFCARMGGMKKKLTGAKTKSDPNSRINKSLRKWNC